MENEILYRIPIPFNLVEGIGGVWSPHPLDEGQPVRIMDKVYTVKKCDQVKVQSFPGKGGLVVTKNGHSVGGPVQVLELLKATGINNKMAFASLFMHQAVVNGSSAYRFMYVCHFYEPSTLKL